MKLTHCCIITENIQELAEFYKEALQIKPQIYGEDYVEFPTEGGVLSLFNYEAHEALAKGSVQPASNRCVELEFNVENVEDDYVRLQKFGAEIVKPLTTQPWGNKSFYFRDPDGNLINFYTRTR